MVTNILSWMNHVSETKTNDSNIHCHCDVCMNHVFSKQIARFNHHHPNVYYRKLIVIIMMLIQYVSWCVSNWVLNCECVHLEFWNYILLMIYDAIETKSQNTFDMRACEWNKILTSPNLISACPNFNSTCPNPISACPNPISACLNPISACLNPIAACPNFDSATSESHFSMSNLDSRIRNLISDMSIFQLSIEKEHRGCSKTDRKKA